MMSLRAALSPAARFAIARNMAAAASSAGEKKLPPSSFNDQNNFANYAEAKRAEAKHHGAEGTKWFKYSLYICVPALILVQISAYFGHMKEHHQPRPEFVDYPHMRIRTRDYPWGGNKSLLHNPETNALPGTGYEVEDPYLAHSKH